jgi:hypothetical protein
VSQKRARLLRCTGPFSNWKCHDSQIYLATWLCVFDFKRWGRLGGCRGCFNIASSVFRTATTTPHRDIANATRSKKQISERLKRRKSKAKAFLEINNLLLDARFPGGRNCKKDMVVPWTEVSASASNRITQIVESIHHRLTPSPSKLTSRFKEIKGSNDHNLITKILDFALQSRLRYTPRKMLRWSSYTAAVLPGMKPTACLIEE